MTLSPRYLLFQTVILDEGIQELDYTIFFASPFSRKLFADSTIQ